MRFLDTAAQDEWKEIWNGQEKAPFDTDLMGHAIMWAEACESQLSFGQALKSPSPIEPELSILSYGFARARAHPDDLIELSKILARYWHYGARLKSPTGGGGMLFETVTSDMERFRDGVCEGLAGKMLFRLGWRLPSQEDQYLGIGKIPGQYLVGPNGGWLYLGVVRTTESGWPHNEWVLNDPSGWGPQAKGTASTIFDMERSLYREMGAHCYFPTDWAPDKARASKRHFFRRGRQMGEIYVAYKDGKEVPTGCSHEMANKMYGYHTS